MNRIRTLQLAVPLACFLIVLFPQAGASELKPDTISPTHRSGSEPQLVSDGEGDVVAVWRDVDDNAESIRAAFRPKFGSFEKSETDLRPGGYGRVAARRDGRARQRRRGVARIDDRPRQHRRGRGSARRRRVERSTGPVRPERAGLRRERLHPERPHGRGLGRARAVATGDSERQQDDDGPLDAAGDDLRAIGGSYTPTISLDDKGGAVAAWQWWDGSYRRIEAAIRSSDGDWSKPEELSRRDTRPRLRSSQWTPPETRSPPGSARTASRRQRRLRPVPPAERGACRATCPAAAGTPPRSTSR